MPHGAPLPESCRRCTAHPRWISITSFPSFGCIHLSSVPRGVEVCWEVLVCRQLPLYGTGSRAATLLVRVFFSRRHHAARKQNPGFGGGDHFLVGRYGAGSRFVATASDFGARSELHPARAKGRHDAVDVAHPRIRISEVVTSVWRAATISSVLVSFRCCSFCSPTLDSRARMVGVVAFHEFYYIRTKTGCSKCLDAYFNPRSARGSRPTKLRC